MSIIGTRPPLISETNFYELHHRARLAIKPGITGMWQVSGRSDITDFEEVVRLDKEYMYRRNYSAETNHIWGIRASGCIQKNQQEHRYRDSRFRRKKTGSSHSRISSPFKQRVL